MIKDRSTKEIVTPSGAKVVVYDFLTGGELRRIQALYMESLNTGDIIDANKKENAQSAFAKVPATIIHKAQDLILGIILVSVNGGAQDMAFQDAMDLAPEDLEVVLKEAEPYLGGDVPKKKSSEPLQTTLQGE